MSDGLGKVSDGVRKVSDGVGKVSFPWNLLTTKTLTRELNVGDTDRTTKYGFEGFFI